MDYECTNYSECPTPKIFGIDYCTYDKFIDCLLENIEVSSQFIPTELIKFFSTADAYGTTSGREQLSAWVMRKNLLELAGHIDNNNDDNQLAKELLKWIDKCLSKLKCKVL